MARIRMIKPEFFDDPDLADISPLARLFFIGLWTQADKEGRLPDDPKRLKARLLPYETVDVECLAVELHGKDVIRRYEGSDGKRYIWIRSFAKHQRPHPKEPASVIPPCQNGAGKRHGEPGKDTASRVDSPLESNGTRNLDSETRNLEDGKKTPSSVNGRSKRPIFSGQRFVVFDWMLEDMARTLGAHADGFDLHSWFFDLDAAAVDSGAVLAKAEVWPWLQAQLVDEAKRRGLPMAKRPDDFKVKPFR